MTRMGAVRLSSCVQIDCFYCSCFMPLLHLPGPPACSDTGKLRLTKRASLSPDPSARCNKQNRTLAYGLSGQN